jgi:subtilisin family serine protease
MKKRIIASAIGLALSGSAVAGETPATFDSNDDLMNVHNRCIVQLRSDIDPSRVRGMARNMAAQAGGSLRYVYNNSINGFTINLPCQAVDAAFGWNANVISMEPDSVASISKGRPGGGGGGGEEGQTASYGTARVGGPMDGTGNTAWIIDTGIDLTHPDLNVDVARGFTAINTKGEPNMNDENGHGTHVAGTIGAINNSIGALGVAPNTTVIPVRVLDRRGSGTISGVIAGVDWVGAHALPDDCANMSLGGGASQTLDDAVVGASNSSGAFFVLAAGNSGNDANGHSPARANGINVWTISAIDSSDNMPSWSNFGNPPIDFAAPGVSIFSLWKNGGTRSISGTSMASPHACAVIMMTNGNPGSDGTAGNDPDGNPDPIIQL